MTQSYDVVGIGNAIVDILAYVEPEFLEQFDLPLGGMTLTDAARAEKIYNAMGTATECSGGSVANTMASLADLELKVAYMGRVSNDAFGKIFTHDMKSVGVDFKSDPAKGGLPTAKCNVLVTHSTSDVGGVKKVERTMATFLGACTEFSKADLDAQSIAHAKVLYIEGYLWDQPKAIEAIEEAIKTAKDSGTKIAFSLSDTFCVDRHRDAFMALVKNDIDILFANEHEIESLLQTSDAKNTLFKLKDLCETVCMTMGEKGAYVLNKGDIHHVETDRISPEDIYDVTGAGDGFAAGFLYGYVKDWDADRSAKLGNRTAGKVIQYLGGRAMTRLTKLLETA